ncbi:NAD-binding protein [Flavobacterium sp.]|jgi:alanine dehydrogenase|uniref:NAD-binding protein n=1 Tax=Flavobacterium sp. TaxID=239 RepID=UPI0037BF6A0B
MKYKIGIPKEIKANERRVSMVPQEVRMMVERNVPVYVETNAGVGAGFTDDDYIKSGAFICNTPEEVFNTADVIVKVKEPLESEYELIRDKHIVFSFFHFASCLPLLQAMIESRTSCIAYETIQQSVGDEMIFPVLAPMSVIAGEQAMISAHKYMEKEDLTVDDIDVIVIGAGNVGRSAAEKARELGYKSIHLVDRNLEKLKSLSHHFQVYEMNDGNLRELLHSKYKIIIGSIYNIGIRAQKILSNELLDLIPDKSIIMDVAIDQGGMTEYSRPTTITDPLIMHKNVKIYCVPNIPSAVPHEASCKISAAIYPYLCTLISTDDLDAAVSMSAEFASGLNIRDGKICHDSLLSMLSLL